MSAPHTMCPCHAVGWRSVPPGCTLFLFCTSCLKIQCAETKLNKNHQHYKSFKPGAFARELGLLHPEGPCLCQQAAGPSRSVSVEPGAWCWEPDVHAMDVQTRSSLDLWTGHPAVIWGQALCSCSVSPGFHPSEGKPWCLGAAPCCKEEHVVGRHRWETRFKSVLLIQSQTRSRYACRVSVPCSRTKGFILS